MTLSAPPLTELAQKRRPKAFHLATIVETKTSLGKRAVVHNHKCQSGSPRSRLSCAAASRRISSTLRIQSKRLRTRSRSRHDLTRLDSELKLAKEDVVVKRKGQRTESFRRFGSHRLSLCSTEPAPPSFPTPLLAVRLAPTAEAAGEGLAAGDLAWPQVAQMLLISNEFLFID